jgi:RNA polymerase sigma factor (sigma-70 family)
LNGKWTRGQFDASRFYYYAREVMAHAFEIPPLPRSYHHEQINQLLKDEQRSLFCFLNAHSFLETELRAVRGFSQEQHRVLFCGEPQDQRTYRHRRLTEMRARPDCDSSVGSAVTLVPTSPIDLPTSEIDVQKRIAIVKCLESLPEKERVILELRLFEGLTNNEITAHLGVPEYYVHSNLRRAVRRIAEMLEKGEGDLSQ